MPSPDPSLNPTTSQGPFSRYLDPQTAAEGTELTQRPSGFMGTTGKLAMFGGQILKGLMQGKAQNYARREQEKYEQFEKKAREVQAFQALPDVPDDAKAQAALYLQQGWSTLTKEQVKDAKKNHGKDGPGGQVLGFFSGIADKLGGPTPAEHKAGGQPWDKLNSMLAEYHSGGPKYSKEARFSDLEKQIATAAKPYAANYDWAGASGDEKVNAPLAQLYQLEPKRAQFRYGQLRESMTPPDPRIKAFASMDTEAKRQQSQQPAQVTATPSAGQQVVPGNIGVVQPVTDRPTLDKPQAGSVASVQPGVATGGFKPYPIRGGIVINTPELESRLVNEWIPQSGDKGENQWYKRVVPGPNGTNEFQKLEVKEYPTFGRGIAIDKVTGRKVDMAGEGWESSTQTEKAPTVPKPDKPRTPRPVEVPGPNGPIRILVDPMTNKRIPDSEALPVYERARVGRGARGGGAGVPGEPKPMTFAQKQRLMKDHSTLTTQEQNQWRMRKQLGDAANAKVGQEIVNPMSKSGAKIKVTDALKAQWHEASEEAREKALEYQGQLDEKKRELGLDVGDHAAKARTPQPVEPAAPAPSGPKKSVPSFSQGGKTLSPGLKVNLANGQTVTIKQVYSDGTFDY